MHDPLDIRYPGLPVDDLMYVKLGYGPEGQAIDLEKLQVGFDTSLRVC